MPTATENSVDLQRELSTSVPPTFAGLTELTIDNLGNVLPFNIGGHPINLPSGALINGLPIGSTVLPSTLIPIVGTIAHRGMGKEVFISNRTDDLPGTGSPEDPFDGSTRTKFDDKIAELYASGIDGLVIWVSHGTFITRGNQIRAQWKIYAAGKGRTIFKLDPTMTPTAGQQKVIFWTDSTTDGNGIVLDGMTLDCNTQNIAGATANGQNNFKTYGAFVYGNYNRYRDVEVINAYGSSANNLESFDLGMEGANGTAPMGNLIEGCSASSPRGDYQNAMCINNPSGLKTPNGMGNTIQHCVVNDYHVSAAHPLVAFSAGSVIDCTADGCDIACRYEPSTDLQILNNRVYNSYGRGVSIEDASGANNALIFGNTIELRNDATGLGQAILLQDSGGTNTNVVVSTNTFLIKDVSGVAEIRAIVTGSGMGHGYRVINNTLQTGVTCPNLPSDTYIVGNRTETGAVIPDLLDAHVPQNNLATSVNGSLQVTGTFSGTDGLLQYAISATDYVIVSGDKLKYDVFIAEDSASHRPWGTVKCSDLTYGGDADQNGLKVQTDRSDLSLVALGKWYTREFDLTASIGKTAQKFAYGERASEISAGVAGTFTFYFANARIVSSSGLLRRSYITGFETSGTLELSTNVAVNSALQFPGSLVPILGISSLRGLTNIFISVRTDGREGSGTAEDPFDGGSAIKLDAILDAIVTPTEVALVGGPGTVFETNGLLWNDNSKGWRVKDGLRLDGGGATLQLVTYPNSWAVSTPTKHVVVGTRYYEDAVSDVFIKDLVIDCNWVGIASPYADKAVMGGYIYADHNVEWNNVTVINAYGDVASSMECFSLSISGGVTVGVAMDLRIVDCHASDPHGDYVDAFTITGYDAAHLARGGRITGCTATGDFYPYITGTSWSQNIEIFDNECDDCPRVAGFYTDTGSINGLGVKRNRFTGVAFGIRFLNDSDNTNEVRNIDLSDNTIRVTSAISAYEPIAVGMVNSGLCSNVRIAHNTLSASGACDAAIEIGGYVTSVQVIGNTIDIPAGTEIYFGLAGLEPLVAHNIKATGAPVTALHNCTNIPIDPATGGGAVDNQFNRNSSRLGALKVTGTYPGGSNQVLQYYFASSYVVQAGDTLQYEVFSEESNPRWYPTTLIQFTDTTNTSTMVDQNGITHQEGDIPQYARGRWYYRKGVLTPYVGKTIDRVRVGANTGAAETLTEYWRNLRIVDVNGQTAATFYGDFDTPPLLQTAGVGITNYSGAPAFNAATLFTTTTGYDGSGTHFLADDGTFKFPVVPRTTLTEADTLVLAQGTDQDSTASGTLTTVDFSGTPNYSQHPTVLRLVVSGGPWTLTIPTCYRIGETGSTTSITLEDGNHELSFVWADSKYWLCDSADTSEPITTSGLTMATARLLGRTTASSGAVEEISVGSGLSLSAGTLSCTVSGGSMATDALWDAKGDLAVGTGADTGAKLTVGANDKVPVADSAQTTGIRWDYAPKAIALWDVAGSAAQITAGDNEITFGNFNTVTWESGKAAIFISSLALTIGTNVQAYDADLTTWAGITPGTGVGTALGVNVGSAGAFVTNGGALGTPSSGTLTNCTFPTLNQNTTGSAASLSISGQTGLLTVTGLASTSRVKTVRDAADTILELGGSYTPTGTWTSLTLVTPALGTPASGVVTNLTGTASININGTVGATTPTTGAFTSETFTLSHKSTTALATPSALSATQFTGFASTVSGAAIMGFGTTNDVALMNRAGTVCLGVGPNTTVVNIPGSLTIATPLAVAQGGTGASSASITAFNNITGFSAAGTTGTTSTNLVFSTSPTFITPLLGTPTSGVLTNCTGLPAASVVAGSLGTGAFTITESVGASGLTLTGATQTSSFPVLNATQTWNASGTAFTALKLNVTNTASAASSALLDLQIGGISKFNIDKSGGINFSASAAIDSPTNNTVRFYCGGYRFVIGSTGAQNINSGLFGWVSSGSDPTGSVDTNLNRDSAGIISFGTTTVNALGSWKATNGTLSGTLSVTGATTLTGGLGIQAAKPGGTIFAHYADTSTTHTDGTEDDLYSDTLVASTLGANGDSVEEIEHVQFVSSATAARRLKKYFGGTLIFDTGALTLTLGADFTIFTTIIRESSSVVRCDVSVTSTSASTVPYSTYTRITGLTLSSTQVLKSAAIASGTGSASGDVVCKMATIQWMPAP